MVLPHQLDTQDDPLDDRECAGYDTEAVSETIFKSVSKGSSANAASTPSLGCYKFGVVFKK